MAIKKTDKDQLLDKASYLFRVKGYHNTSISDIADACHLSKGSIYHYITSKKELGIAVIKRAHRTFQEKIFSIATHHINSPREGLEAILTATREFYVNREGGSLIGNLVHEVMETVPEFTELFKAFYLDWITALAKLLSAKYDATTAKQLAEDTVCQLQGAIMLLRLFKEEAVLNRVGNNLLKNFED